MMTRYRKRPVVISAFCLGADPMPDWFCDAVSNGKIQTFGEHRSVTHCHIETLEGVLRGNSGDYIIQGVKGEIYACKPDIFAMTYEQEGEESMKQTISETREKVRKPLTEEEISETCDTWIIDSISIEEVIIIVRRTERAHGIGVEDE